MSAENLFPLSQALVDKTVTISELTGDRALQSRLLSLGFTPGTKVCICSAAGNYDSCRVIIRNSPLVLDNHAASAVLCCQEAGETKRCPNPEHQGRGCCVKEKVNRGKNLDCQRNWLKSNPDQPVE